jgi:hypothetical protein
MTHRNSSISNFKRFCLRFLGPLLLLLIVCGYLFQYLFERAIILKTDIGGAYKINRIINEVHPQEVAMFGSSRMIQTLIPDLLGPNYYNYGLNGTKDDVVQFFLNEEVKKNKTTPIIINLDIEGLNRQMGSIMYYLYNINYKPVQQLIGNDDKTYYHLNFVKYYGFYELFLKDYLSSRIVLTKYSNKGASIERNVLLPAAFAEMVKRRGDIAGHFNIDPRLSGNLISIINNHPNRQFIFVIAPCHPSCFKNFKNEAEELNYLAKLQSFKNVRVLNYSKANYADSLFFDTEHLNYFGAVKFSKALKDTLAKL